MIDAWLSSSLTTSTSAASARVASTARLAAKPGREQQRGLGALPVGQLGLELVVDGPAADDEARGPAAGAPPVDRLARPRRRPPGGRPGRGSRWRRTTRPAGRRASALGQRAVERADRPPAVRAADRVEARARCAPRQARHPASVTSAMAAATRVDDALDLVGGAGEHRHQHDHVAERPDQHAALHARRPTRAGPSAGRRAGGASSMPVIRPRWRTSRTAPSGATRSARSRGELLGARSRTLASTSRSASSSRWRRATALASAFPL